MPSFSHLHEVYLSRKRVQRYAHFCCLQIFHEKFFDERSKSCVFGNILRSEHLSVDNTKAAIRRQSLWNSYTLRSLVVFEQSSDYSWQSQSRAIKSMAEFSLFLMRSVSAFESVGLIRIEIRHRAYL